MTFYSINYSPLDLGHFQIFQFETSSIMRIGPIPMRCLPNEKNTVRMDGVPNQCAILQYKSSNLPTVLYHNQLMIWFLSAKKTSNVGWMFSTVAMSCPFQNQKSEICESYLRVRRFIPLAVLISTFEELGSMTIPYYSNV